MAGWHPVDLAAELLGQVLGSVGLGPGAVEAVMLGCTSQVGAQAYNIARRAVLAAGWPESTTGTTMESHACSSLQALQLAASAIVSGSQQVLVAGGVESMSAVPLGAPLAQPVIGKPYGTRLSARYKDGRGLLPPGLVAEEVARRWALSRSELDAWAKESRARALVAQAKPPGFLAPLLGAAPGAPGAVPGKPRRKQAKERVLDRDEALGLKMRVDLSRLRPVFVNGGVITAANMAAEGDGASGVLLADQRAAARHGLGAKALIFGFGSVAADPRLWPVATVPATGLALSRARLTKDDIDRWYVHESSSAAVLVWAAETGVSLEKVNVDGGALAVTAPIGALGAGLVAEAVAALPRGRNGTAVVCAAGEGGVGAACVLGLPGG